MEKPNSQNPSSPPKQTGTSTILPNQTMERDDDEAPAMADRNIVFIDTSLDTHLALLVGSSDTTSDFKKKMAMEHMQCFPGIGEIQIQSVKVKRRSIFYHMSDLMPVWSVFEGEKRNRHLFVDASSIRKCVSVPKPVEFELGPANVNGDANKNESLLLKNDKNDVEGMVEESNLATDSMAPDSSRRLVDATGEDGNVINPMKKRKKRKLDKASEQIEKGEKFDPSSPRKIEEGKGFPNQVDASIALKEVSLLQNAEESDLNTPIIRGSNERKEENVLPSQIDCGLEAKKMKKKKKKRTHITVVEEQIAVGEWRKPHSETIDSKEIKGLPLEHENVVVELKKKKVRKTIAKVKETRAVEQIGEGETMKLDDETNDSGRGKSPDHTDRDSAANEATVSKDIDAVTEPAVAGSIKKRKIKKREKKTVIVLGLPCQSSEERKLDGSNEKVLHADLEMKTQTEQTQVINEKTEISAGFSIPETENPIVDPNQVVSDIVSEIQKKFPIEDQQISIEPLATKESFENHEQEIGEINFKTWLSEKAQDNDSNCAKILTELQSPTKSPVEHKKAGNISSHASEKDVREIKNPKKKMLAKSGGIFPENSGDEKGTVHSNESTLSPSDNSSMSGESAAGSDDAKGISSGRRNTSDVRSSKRLKKAKEGESHPFESVPESPSF